MLKVNGNMKVEDVFQGLKEVANPEDAIHMKAYMKDQFEFLVHTDVMEEPAPNKVNHIEIAKQTDLFLVAPASANTIAKLANGFADNMITSTALALPSTAKKVLAPAMNTKMYENPITQENLSKLEKYGWQIIQPRETVLACGDHGIGALASVETIIKKVKEMIYEETI